MIDPVRRFRPALFVAFGAALITLAAGITSLFVVVPPTVEMLFHGHVSLASDVAIHEILQSLRGERCGPLSWSIICRLDWMQAVADQLWDSPVGAQRLAMIGLGILVAGGFAFFFAYEDTPTIENITVKRGRRIETGVYAYRALRQAIRKLGRPQKHDLWLLPEVRLNAASTARNLLLVGTQGSGKTGLMRAFTDQYLESTSGRIFVFDAKGDMLAGLPVDSMILIAPQDARSWAIDIGREITNPLIARELAAKCAPVSEQDPMWGHGTRSVLADIIMALRDRSGEVWNWSDLSDAGLSSAAEIRQMLIESGSKSVGLLNFGEDPEENRTVMSILITLWVTVLSTIEPLARAWSQVDPSHRFTVRDWLSPGSALPRTLLLQKSSDYPELSSTVGSFLAERVAAAALASNRRRPDTDQLTLLLDEFPELPIERLPRVLALGREMHVTTIATVQDLGQITALFGQQQGSVVESRFGIRLVLRLEPGETVRRICEVWVGRRQIRRRRDATVEEMAGGITKPMETVWEDTITPELLSDALGVFETSAGKIIRVLVTGFPTLAIVDVPLTTWADRREAHVPALWIAEPGMLGRQVAESV